LLENHSYSLWAKSNTASDITSIILGTNYPSGQRFYFGHINSANFYIGYAGNGLYAINPDGTEEWLKQRAPRADEMIILHEHNRGKGAAIRTALPKTLGDYVLIQDADLEYDPAEYLKLLPALDSGEAEVVYGSRILGHNSKRSSFCFYWGGRLLSWWTSFLFWTKITDEATCYKVFKRELLLSLPLKCEGFEFCPEVTARLLRRGVKIVEIPISYDPRAPGEGKKIRWTDGLLALWLLLRYRLRD